MTPLAEPQPTPSSLLARMAVGVSVAIHMAAVALSLGYTGAGLYASAPEAVPVSLVAPQDVSAAAEPEASAPLPDRKPEPDLGKLDLRLAPLDSTPGKPQQQQSPQAASKPQNAKAAAPSLPAAQPAYTPPQPDISMRYQVDLGLKMLAAAPPPQAAPSGGVSDYDAPAVNKADIEATSIAAFRARLKQCAALPAQIVPDDKVVIVLRATFTPDGRLVGSPVLIEASASAKGPALMQAAVAALQACQPHTTLPADRYAEWRVLDMRFTPQDFRKG